ncbi:periplasmic chaperone for outer membrane proteins SurA [Sphingomonas laterariae]|uniref:Parvulin-like PPIase n=1 Tax=Edaphosphingomonas laterariae TaxID=861865 RepID=A0A239DCC1_9SPHN|nr:peptidylprolyl isomerase [Sphingomonas laterariae]SNS29678.1 periplasmic chaperone for outer membrane proteins SurA [Sphingomonas laterariae]
MSALPAQTVEDDAAAPASALNLPKDLTIFGSSDPSVRKATAIVNGTIITDTDLDQRLALVVAANGGKVGDEERERLRLQVLRNLIDETLQIQEAKANEITITKAEIDQTFNRVAGNFKRSPEQFSAYLREQGASDTSLRRQIEGELAWRRLLGRRVEPFVNVGEEEVNAVIQRLNASKGAVELHIAEIYLSSTPENAGETLQNAQRIVAQIKQGASFVAYARQFSEASTAAVGGDLGWVRPEQLPESLAGAAATLERGQISEPVAVPGGYSIIALVDKRQVLTADPRDAQLALKQVAISFPKGMTQAQAAPKVEEFANMMKSITGCGTVDKIAQSIGAEVVDNDQIRIRDLPAPLQQMMINLQVGQATQPFGSLEDGVRALVLCGRDDAQAASGPSFDQILAQMEEERINRRARRYLRDLRRDAVVDYR